MTMTPEMESDLALIAQACTGPISGPAYDRFKAALSAQAKVRVTDEAVKSAFDRYWDVYWTVSPPKDREMQRNKDGSMSTKSVPPNLAPICAALEDFAARLSQDSSWQAIVQHCMVTEAVTPREDDPYGTINDIISWHVNADRLSQGAQGVVEMPTRSVNSANGPAYPAERAAVPDGFDGERYCDMVDAYDEAVSKGWNREQAMGCAIRAYYAAPQPPEGARVVPEGDFDFCTNRFTARPVTDDRYEILDKHGRVQWGRVPHENMRMKIESGEWTVLAAPTLAGKGGTGDG